MSGRPRTVCVWAILPLARPEVRTKFSYQRLVSVSDYSAVFVILARESQWKMEIVVNELYKRLVMLGKKVYL